MILSSIGRKICRLLVNKKIKVQIGAACPLPFTNFVGGQDDDEDDEDEDGDEEEEEEHLVGGMMMTKTW